MTKNTSLGWRRLRRHLVLVSWITWIDRIDTIQVLKYKNINFRERCLIAELKTAADWNALNYAKLFDCSLDAFIDNVPRIDATLVPHEQFSEEYERPYRPVVIRNAQLGWKAQTTWNYEVRIFSTLIFKRASAKQTLAPCDGSLCQYVFSTTWYESVLWYRRLVT